MTPAGKTVPYMERRSSDRRKVVTVVAPEHERRALIERRLGDIRQGWLCFDSGTSRVRVHPAPEGWESCTEEQLEAIRKAGAVVSLRGAGL